MTNLRAVIRFVIETPIQGFAYLTFLLFSYIPFDGLVERLIQALSFVIRYTPENRINRFFIRYSLMLTDHRFKFTFKTRVGILWPAATFPDLLTRHLMFEGTYQQDVVIALQRFIKPGDVVFDIGGHHGFMTIISSKAASGTGKIVAFEPNPFSREQLERNLALNNVTNVIVEGFAVTDKPDEKLPFYIQKGEVSWNSTIIPGFAHGFDQRGGQEAIEVWTTTIDKYVGQSGACPNVIKVDVEGAEFAVLSGAVDTLRRCRPVVVIEFNPVSANAAGHTIGDYVELFRQQAYGLSVFRGNRLGYYKPGAVEPFDEGQHTAKHGVVNVVNVICIPRREGRHLI